MSRLGVTIPLEGALGDQHAAIAELGDLGVTDLWSAEADGYDGLTPLALASTWAPTMRLGTAVLPVYTRGPALLAQSVATMAAAAPGRFVAGLGTSSDVIIERWNGLEFDRPYQRVRDTVRFLRAALTGDKVTHDYETFSVTGFRLRAAVPEPPKVMVAALRAGMLRLAGRESDGAIVNWLSIDDVDEIGGIVHDAGPDAEIVARLFVLPTEDRAVARQTARFVMAAYLNVPVYRAFHEWRGRGPALAEHWDRWAAGDRAGGPLEAIPDALVDELVVHGSPAECAEHVARYVDAGITTPVLLMLPVPGVDWRPWVAAIGGR